MSKDVRVSRSLMNRATYVGLGASVLFAGSLLTVLGCSVQEPQKGKSVTTEAKAVSSRVLLDPRRAGLGIEVTEASGVNQVAITGKLDATDYSALELKSPPRLVIDLPPNQISSSQKVDSPDLEFLSGIRVGAHPDKTRVVIDLPSDLPVSHAIERDGNTLRITLADAQNGAAQPMAQAKLGGSTESKKIETSATDSNVVAMDDLINPDQIASNDSANVTEKTETTESKLAAKLPETADSSVVTQVTLKDEGSSGPVVTAKVKGHPEYNLERTAPSEYVLTLNNTTLDSHAGTAPVMSKSRESIIRGVRSATQDGKVLVRVFVNPTSTLEVKNTADGVVIEPTKLSVETSRAQAKPEALDAEDSADVKGPAVKVEKTEKTEVAKDSKGNVKVEKETTTEVSHKETSKDGTKDSAKEIASDSELSSLLGDSSQYTGRLISLDLQDTDINNALRIIAEVSNLNIVASDDVAGKVTLRLIDVPWDQALDVILKTNGLDKVAEGNVVRIAPVEKLRQEREALKQAQQAEVELEPLNVKYLRVSYAKASELKPLIETVLSERGTVNYDERSNQLVIKDVKKGIKNVIELVNKIDLRTPQILLETQIVEASRDTLRELGATLGYNFVASPATGNATGWNFPNSVVGNFGSNFPAPNTNSAIDLLFGSADGSQSLTARLTQFESEGKVRIISRPAVATTNNKKASIKSVEKVRIRLPSGGVSVATGSGAAASGSNSNATETIEIGIVLDVTPQASPDYYVLLDIDAKSSTFGTSAPVDGIPSEVERSATSSVLVSSGQTFALGGIYKLSNNDSVKGVPYLKDIPFFGHFFRVSSTTGHDEELLFFITPRIVEGSFDDAALKATL